MDKWSGTGKEEEEDRGVCVHTFSLHFPFAPFGGFHFFSFYLFLSLSSSCVCVGLYSCSEKRNETHPSRPCWISSSFFFPRRCGMTCVHAIYQLRFNCRHLQERLKKKEEKPKAFKGKLISHHHHRSSRSSLHSHLKIYSVAAKCGGGG